MNDPNELIEHPPLSYLLNHAAKLYWDACIGGADQDVMAALNTYAQLLQVQELKRLGDI